MPETRSGNIASRLLERLRELSGKSVYVGRIPGDADIPVPPDALVLGTVVYGEARPSTITAYCDAPSGVDAVHSFYDAELGGRGFSRREVSHPVTMDSPFRLSFPSAYGDEVTYCRGEGSLFYTLMVRAKDVTEIRVTKHDADAGPNIRNPCQAPEPASAYPPYRRVLSAMPILEPPAGVRMMPGGSGGSDRDWRGDAFAFTDLSAADLLAHFGAQFEANGAVVRWRGAQGPIAWGRWSLGHQDYEALLVVVEGSAPGIRDVMLHVESPSHREAAKRMFTGRGAPRVHLG